MAQCTFVSIIPKSSPVILLYMCNDSAIATAIVIEQHIFIRRRGFVRQHENIILTNFQTIDRFISFTWTHLNYIDYKFGKNKKKKYQKFNGFYSAFVTLLFSFTTVPFICPIPGCNTYIYIYINKFIWLKATPDTGIKLIRKLTINDILNENSVPPFIGQLFFLFYSSCRSRIAILCEMV